MKKLIKFIVGLLLLSYVLIAFSAEYLDGIAAVVEDDIILESELASEVVSVMTRLRTNHVPLPPEKVIYKQVLERMIIDKLQSQLARRSGLQVSDKMVDASLDNIARQNGLDIESFKQELNKEGMNFEDFKDSVRKEILVNQLRSREIGGRVRVSESEINHYLDTEMSAEEMKVQYLLGHILLSVSEGASADMIQEKAKEAASVIKQLRNGADFKQMAVSISDGSKAFEGGVLGWRTLNNIPTLFVDTVKRMKKGDVANAIRSPGGFHILKLLDSTGVDTHIITETHVRHILIKTNEIVSDEDAKSRLQALSERIIGGDDFAVLAKANSDDTGSAIQGGDLGWVTPGVLVPPFEKAMQNLAINALSPPIQTQFGWHLIQVLARRTKDNTEAFKRDQARHAIRKRKIEEETELWLRRLRDEAYVDIRLGALNDS